jgi:flagellar hook protein FlgE
MLNSLNSGVSGLQQFQGQLGVIGNNIANSNTIGYKSARTDFADAFSQSLQVSSAGAAGTSSTPSMQVGSGVTTASIRNLFTQGSMTRTGVGTDLAISQNGFFVVRDPVNSVQYVTRAGDFRMDQNGFLVTNKGFRIQGFSDADLTTRGDIQIDASVGRPATSDPNASMVGFNIDTEGRVHVRLSDGTEYVRGQILLQNFRDPQALLKEGENLYSAIAAAGPLAQPEAAGTNGLGRIQAGALELSNVDLANEFATLITTQRGFQASARIITTSDEVLQELVNLKR